MARKKNKDGYVLKSEVQLIIQNYIRNIQMNDYGNDNGIPQLYAVMKQIEDMKSHDIEDVKYHTNKFESLIEHVNQGKLPPLNVKQKSINGLSTYKNG